MRLPSSSAVLPWSTVTGEVSAFIRSRWRARNAAPSTLPAVSTLGPSGGACSDAWLPISAAGTTADAACRTEDSGGGALDVAFGAADAVPSGVGDGPDVPQPTARTKAGARRTVRTAVPRR